jgi:hypothetical protein
LRFVLDEPFALGIGETEQQLLALFLESVGDVFQEESFRTGTIVFRPCTMGCRHCLLGGGPELDFEAKSGTVLFVVGCFRFRHGRETTEASAGCQEVFE